MRHLTTEELLLYAEGELSERQLCRHVADCVECKAQMVDLQEAYVAAATAIRRQVEPQPVRPIPLRKLRERLAAEAELLSAHLSVRDLLLSVEDELDHDGRAHLAQCGHCQDQAANLLLELAEIEVELHRQAGFVLPDERRAAALAALRARLQVELERQTARPFSVRDWLPPFALPRIPAFASYSLAFAAVCLMAWWGVGVVIPGPAPEPVLISRIELPAPPASALAVAQEPEDLAEGPGVSAHRPAREATRLLQRFTLAADTGRPTPTAPASLDWAPTLVLQPMEPQDVSLTPDILAVTSLPAWPPDAPGQVPLPVAPGSAAVSPQSSTESVIEGNWMLVRAGLWDQDVRAGGADGTILFVGSVASERARLDMRQALDEVAGELSVEYAISVRDNRSEAAGGQLATALGVGQEPVGAVRNSLLEHYGDAARRSFQVPDWSLLESELDRYVTRVLRHDTELLSHANALQRFLSEPGMEAMRNSDGFRRVVRFHLDAIWDHQAGIHELLSEALPRRFWAYRSRTDNPRASDSMQEESLGLRADALSLDRALTSLLFGSGEALAVGDGEPSVNSLLKRLRQRTERLRSAAKTSLN